ncbi:MAG: SprB repeat-containing protein, partial [Bacteroidetes bacterium]|nr:SprB repeat-containing protein [Bacteroidota bacterium]
MKANKLLFLKFLLGLCFLIGFVLIGNRTYAQNWTIDPTEGCKSVTNFNITVDLAPVSKTCSDILLWEYRITYGGGSTGWVSVGNAGSCTFSQTPALSGIITWRVTMLGGAVKYLSPQTIIDAPSDAGTVTPAATVCTGNNSGTLTTSAPSGEPVRWEYSTDGTVTWTTIANTTYDQSYLNLTTTTYYRCVVKNYTCAEAASSSCLITVEYPPSTSVTAVDITCNGTSDGEIAVSTPSVGTAPFTYYLTGKTPLTGQTVGYTYTGLAAGTYTFYFTDAVGCDKSPDYIRTINEPPAIVSSTSQTNLSCYGVGTGSLTITASGGSSYLAYSIDGINWLGSNVFTGLSIGTYTVQIRDANHTNCIHTNVPNVVITQPLLITKVSESVTNPSCYGGAGAILITYSGGTAPLQYTMGADVNTTGVFSRTNGTWSYSVTDANSCAGFGGSVTVVQPLQITKVSESVTNPSCYGDAGAILITYSGGTAPLQY